MIDKPSPPAPLAPAHREQPVQVKVTGIQGNVVSLGAPDGDPQNWRSRLQDVFGSASPAFVDAALLQLQAAARLPGGGVSEIGLNAAVAMIAACAPADEIDAALALQAACLHMVAMAVLARIGGTLVGTQRLPGLSSAAAKLIRAHATTVETLRRRRFGSGQHIRVEHVHVHEGGQAIVGLVNKK